MKKTYKPMVVTSLHDLAQEEIEPIEVTGTDLTLSISTSSVAETDM